jgi:hypothetical protein
VPWRRYRPDFREKDGGRGGSTGFAYTLLGMGVAGISKKKLNFQP